VGLYLGLNLDISETTQQIAAAVETYQDALLSFVR